MGTFSKHYSKFKTVSINFRKTLQERRLQISTFWQDNPQNHVLNFSTSKNIFITLQCSRDMLGIFLKQTFVECSTNILETLLRDLRDQHLLLPNHTLLTRKQLFHQELFNSPNAQCSLDIPNIATLREHSANIPGILRVGWTEPP